MNKTVITLWLCAGMLFAQDAAGSYKLSGVNVRYTFISREEVALTVTDAYGLGVTQTVSTIPAAAPFTSKDMKFNDAELKAVGINLNINLTALGEGSVVEGSYYPDVNTIIDENGSCNTIQQVLPVSDIFTYTSSGTMMADSGKVHPGFNVLGLPGISSMAGEALGGFGISGSSTFEDFASVPTHPTLCGPDGNCYNFTVGDLDGSGTVEIYPALNTLGFTEYVPGGQPLTGLSGGYFLKKDLNTAGDMTSMLEGNTAPDFYLEWHGVDGASSGLGYSDDEETDEDGDGTWQDRQIGIPGITATYMSSACGFTQPIYGDVTEAFTAAGQEACIDTVSVASSGYLMDPSGSLATWSNFLTAHGALYQMCLGYEAAGTMDVGTCNALGDLLEDDSTTDMDPTCLDDYSPGNFNALLDCAGRLTMNFNIPCVPILEAREVIAEFVDVANYTSGCMDMDACNYSSDATIELDPLQSCIYGTNTAIAYDADGSDPCYVSGSCDYDCNGASLDINNSNLISGFSVDNIYPNPFNPILSIVYSIPVPQHVLINVYDLSGRLLETLKQEYMAGGQHSIKWNASKYPSGIYLVEFRSNEFVNTRKVILMK